MSQPTPFNRTHDYTEELGTQHGINLDEEMNDIELTLDETTANLALIQRDDTKLANASVHPDALSSATLTLLNSDFTPRGEWATATVYAVGDIVEVTTTGSYIATTAHTAGAVFATDKAAGKWISLSGTTLAVLAASTSAAGIGSTGGTVQAVLDAKQALDATLTALAALTIAADSLSIGTGADAFTQTTFAANTFPAKASTGALVAKPITDAALTILDDTTVGAIRTTLGVGEAQTPTFAGATLVGGALTGAVRVDVADNATINLDTAASNYVRLVTSTTTITAITLAAGKVCDVLSNTVRTLTNGASLILPGGLNITTAVGDTWRVIGEAAGVVRVVNYERAAGISTQLLAHSAVSVGVGVVTSEEVLATISIPANTLGLNGRINAILYASTSNGAGTKTYRVRMDGAAGTIFATLVLSTHTTGILRLTLANRAATNSQSCFADTLTDAGVAAIAVVTGTIDTTAATTLVITGQKSVSGDSLALSQYQVHLVK